MKLISHTWATAYYTLTLLDPYIIIIIPTLTLLDPSIFKTALSPPIEVIVTTTAVKREIIQQILWSKFQRISLFLANL